MEARSRCCENIQHDTFNIKPGSQRHLPEKVIFKLGAEGGREGVNKAEAREGWRYQELCMQRPRGRRRTRLV